MKTQFKSTGKQGLLSARVVILVMLFGLAVMPGFLLATAELAKTKIIIGGDYDYPPYSFFDKSGIAKGFDVDLIKAVAERIDAEIEFVFTPWDEAVQNLKTGKVDLLLATLYTEDRTRYFDFTIPYNLDYYSIFSLKGSNIQSVNDLHGKNVIILKGDASIENFIKPLDLVKNISHAVSYPEAFKRLLSGQHDYILAPFAIASNTIKELEQQGKNTADIISTNETLLPSLYRLAVKKGNAELLTTLNDSLDALKSENKIQMLRDRWITKRPASWEATTVIKYVLISIIPIVLLIISFLLWSWSHKRQVAKKSESLKKTIKKAELANLAKSRFLASMNHEIRTPLNAISGFSQALMIDCEKKSLGEDIAKLAKNTYTAAERLTGTINNIMEISKIESGKIELQLADFNIKKTVQAMFGLYKVKALNQDVIFNIGYDPGLPEMIHSDREKLTRTLNILIESAIKFTPAGKSIWLKVKTENRFIELQLEGKGIEIEASFIRNIFKPFEQYDDFVIKTFGPVGLDLALAKTYVEMLNGTASVVSCQDHAAILVIRIPILPT